jgi:phage terminase large subunit-like protein
MTAGVDLVRLEVPAPDERPWPTLGPYVCQWIEDNLVHGPGDVLGERVKLTREETYILYRAYEVFPKGHPRAGRRRFKRVVVSRRKGWAKTELGAWVAITEMDPDGPVRCGGWQWDDDVRTYVPVPRAILDPYIPMIAYTEEQVEDLAYGAVRAILTARGCPLRDRYDVGLDRVLHRAAPGVITAVAAAPDSRDGARTTFDHRDETHRQTTARLRDANDTMDQNLTKRAGADAWSLATTTMYGPGEGSQAERDHRWAEDIATGKVDPEHAAMYFDHLQASERWDIDDDDELERAILQAAGDTAWRTDTRAIISLHFRRPGVDVNKSRRYQLNQRRRLAQRWVAVADVWAQLADPSRVVADTKADEPDPIVVAFDGSYRRDSTALIGATVAERPHVFELAVWERPLTAAASWRVPRATVLDTIRDVLDRYRVVELAADPPGWGVEIEQLEGEYDDVIVVFETNQPSKMGPAIDGFEQLAQDGLMTHDGSLAIARHIENVVPDMSRGRKVIRKEHPDSDNKIDAAVGAVVAVARAVWHDLHDDEPQQIVPFAIWR